MVNGGPSQARNPAPAEEDGRCFREILDSGLDRGRRRPFDRPCPRRGLSVGRSWRVTHTWSSSRLPGDRELDVQPPGPMPQPGFVAVMENDH